MQMNKKERKRTQYNTQMNTRNQTTGHVITIW